VSEVLDLAKKSVALTDARDLAGLRGIMSPDVAFWEPAVTLKGVDAVAGYFANYATPFPVATTKIKRWAEGDGTAILECEVSLTHTGTLRTPQGEIPPSGRTIVLPYCHVVRAEAGRITSLKLYYDQITFLTQLGLMPAPAGA
jgi:ketosteroid isomerase-like protein